jgi:hypothetical protein
MKDDKFLPICLVFFPGVDEFLVPGPGNLGIFVTAGGTSQRPPIQAGYSFAFMQTRIRHFAILSCTFDCARSFFSGYPDPRALSSDPDPARSGILIHCMLVLSGSESSIFDHAYQLFLGS